MCLSGPLLIAALIAAPATGLAEEKITAVKSFPAAHARQAVAVDGEHLRHHEWIPGSRRFAPAWV